MGHRSSQREYRWPALGAPLQDEQQAFWATSAQKAPLVM
jgi:hypothetical protein